MFAIICVLLVALSRPRRPGPKPSTFQLSTMRLDTGSPTFGALPAVRRISTASDTASEASEAHNPFIDHGENQVGAQKD